MSVRNLKMVSLSSKILSDSHGDIPTPIAIGITPFSDSIWSIDGGSLSLFYILNVSNLWVKLSILGEQFLISIIFPKQ